MQTIFVVVWSPKRGSLFQMFLAKTLETGDEDCKRLCFGKETGKMSRVFGIKRFDTHTHSAGCEVQFRFCQFNERFGTLQYC